MIRKLITAWMRKHPWRRGPSVSSALLLGGGRRGRLGVFLGPACIPRQGRVFAGKDVPQLSQAPHFPLEALLRRPKTIDKFKTGRRPGIFRRDPGMEAEKLALALPLFQPPGILGRSLGRRDRARRLVGIPLEGRPPRPEPFGPSRGGRFIGGEIPPGIGPQDLVGGAVMSRPQPPKRALLTSSKTPSE